MSCIPLAVVFVNVILPEPVSPTGTFPKFRLAGVACRPLPKPPSSSTCGLPGALSVKLTTAASAPATDGVKPTSNAQTGVDPGLPGAVHAPGATISEKSALFAPVIVKFVMLSGD